MEKSRFIAPLHDYVLLQSFQRRIMKVVESWCNRSEMKRLVENHKRRSALETVCATYPCLSWKLMHAHTHFCLPNSPLLTPVTQALSKHELSSLELFTRLVYSKPVCLKALGEFFWAHDPSSDPHPGKLSRALCCLHKHTTSWLWPCWLCPVYVYGQCPYCGGTIKGH